MRDPNETENERPQPPPKTENGRKKGYRAKAEEVNNVETQLTPAKKSRKKDFKQEGKRKSDSIFELDRLLSAEERRASFLRSFDGTCL